MSSSYVKVLGHSSRLQEEMSVFRLKIIVGNLSKSGMHNASWPVNVQENRPEMESIKGRSHIRCAARCYALLHFAVSSDSCAMRC